MPEHTQPDEIIIELKCARCFTKLVIGDPERNHFAFCTDACRMEGRFFPTEKKMIVNSQREKWRKKHKEKARAYALKSYHKNKTLKVKGRGRPRLDGSNLLVHNSS